MRNTYKADLYERFWFIHSSLYCLLLQLLFAHAANHSITPRVKFYVLRVTFAALSLHPTLFLRLSLGTTKTDEFKLENCSFDQIMAADYRNNKKEKKTRVTNLIYIVWMWFLYHDLFRKEAKLILVYTELKEFGRYTVNLYSSRHSVLHVHSLRDTVHFHHKRSSLHQFGVGIDTVIRFIHFLKFIQIYKRVIGDFANNRTSQVRHNALRFALETNLNIKTGNRYANSLEIIDKNTFSAKHFARENTFQWYKYPFPSTQQRQD